MQPLSGKMRFSGQKVPKTEGFLRFYFFWSNPLRESGCRVSKTEGFLRVFFGPVHPSQGKRGSSVKNWCFFCDFGVPESVLRIVLTIRFATYGRFLKRAKMSENRQKTLKTEGFLRFFMFEATLCGNPAVECQKLRVFCDFGVPESVLTTCFATYGLLQGCPEVPRGGFRLV